MNLALFFCFYMRKVRFLKNRKRVFSPQFINYLSTSSTRKGQVGAKWGIGGFFSKSYIYLDYYTFVYTYKNNPPFPQKSPEALKTLTFLWGIFSKMPRKKPPKSPHRGQKSPTGQKNTPQGWLNLTGRGLIFISTNILLRGLYLRFQSRGLEI